MLFAIREKGLCRGISCPSIGEFSALRPTELLSSIAADFFNAIRHFPTLGRCPKPDIRHGLPPDEAALLEALTTAE